MLFANNDFSLDAWGGRGRDWVLGEEEGISALGPSGQVGTVVHTDDVHQRWIPGLRNTEEDEKQLTVH